MTAPPEEALRALFAAARDAADAALAASDARRAAAIWADLIAGFPEGHPLTREARFHHALVRELLGEVDAAIDALVPLASHGHDGAWKALDRMLEARWSAAREAPPGLAGRPARQSLRDIVEKLATARGAQRDPARQWLDTTEVEDELRIAQDFADQERYAQAVEAFDAAGRRAQAAKLNALARKAFMLAAALSWHRLRDRRSTVSALAALGPDAAANPAVRALAHQVFEATTGEARACLAAGDRDGALARLAAVLAVTGLALPGARELEELYLTELGSPHLTAVRERIDAVGRELDAASRGGDAAAARALVEERELLRALERAVAGRELAVARTGEPREWRAVPERDAGMRDVLLERIQRLSRARVASVLRSAAARRLQLEVDALRAQFLEKAYQRETS